MFQSFILAGGKSSRMNSEKPFIKLGNKTLLQRSVETLNEINNKNITIVIAEQSDKFNDYKTTKDIYKNRGTLGGIHSALANCDKKYALIIACDYPFISMELLNYLIEVAKHSNANCIAPIQKDGIIQPLCSIYQTVECLEILSAILDKSDKTPSARDFLKRIDTKFVEFEEFEHLPNAEHFFFNVNTPEDFETATKIYNSIK